MTPKRNIVFIGLILGLTAVLAGSSSGAAQSLVQPTKRYALVTLLISPSQASLEPGGTTELAANGLGTDNQNHTVTTKITWTSSAPFVATVSSTGVVTAIAPGTAVITGKRGIQSSSIITVNSQEPPGVPVPATLFSMTTHSRMDWPTVTTSAIRLWDTNTYWGDMNPAAAVYDFTAFDKWLSIAQANGADIIYTFGQIPNWASSSPSLVCGSNANVPLGSCAPPDDLNYDGTGTNKHWKDFVTAVVTHANGQIKYWEIWNEPTVPDYWQGNNSQMLRMAQDAYAIIKSIQPSALVTTPTPSTGINGIANWMGPYLALGGGQYADIVTFHGYSWKNTLWPVPEDIVPLVENLKAVLVAYGQDKKPLWCTEGSWGNTGGNGFSDPDLRAAFVARHYLLQESEGVLRYYWYAWDNRDGLWDYTTGTINDSGTAYQEVENWIVGATPSGQCTAVGTLWTCSYTRSGGFQAQAMWDTSQSCSNGSCTTLSIPVGSQYVSYLDLGGQSHTIQNGMAPVGAKPIFMQNQ